MGAYFLYILALEEDNYYVGISRDVYKRYNEHVNHKGAHFTRIYPPIGLICSRELTTWSKTEAEAEETKMTLLMMTLYGVEHVRGGDYYQANIDDVKSNMGDSLYKKIMLDYEKSDKNKILNKYPEIRYGLDLLDRRINYPINISSYHLWPTKNYYDKAIKNREIKNERVSKIVDEQMKVFLDHSIDFDKRINAFKEMVNKAIEIQGYIEFKMTDDDGEDRFYFIDKKMD